MKKLKIQMPAWPEIRNFIRNIMGRYQLFVVLLRWDKVYRREVWVTLLTLILVNYTILDMDSPYDVIALMVEAIIIWMHLGNEFSILPKEYRPHQRGIRLSATPVTYFTHKDEIVPFSEVLPPVSEGDLHMYNPFKDKDIHPETPLCSDILDDHLMQAEHMPYAVQPSDDNYILSVHQIRYLTMRIANKKQHTTNGEKLCLDTSAAGLISESPIPLRKGTYFDGLLTLEAFRTRIYDRNLRGVVEVSTDLTQYYPAETGPDTEKPQLSDDYYRRVSGHIGATSLLISENRKIICLYQGDGKAIDANKVCLGGSGSVDFQEAGKDNDEDLRDVIRRCMARETAEETGLKSDIDEIYENTLLTGFFHWMDRGAKPEFVGITRAGDINFTARSTLDQDEIIRLEEIPITLDQMVDFVKVLDYALDHKMNISLSSLMALQRMAVIAGYNHPKATDAQRQIFADVRSFVFG